MSEDPREKSPRRRHGALLVAAVVWVVAVAAGFSLMTEYGLKTVETAAAAPRNPVVGDEEGRAMLILAAHPKCPCTVATVNELARTLPKVRAPLRVQIALYIPPDEPASWAKAGVWRAAAQIPEVELALDRDGALARTLGAKVSGHAFLYDARGRLLFHGGLTSARGHEGASVGTRAIVSWMNEGHGPETAPVFGCLITAEDALVEEGAM